MRRWTSLSNFVILFTFLRMTFVDFQINCHVYSSITTLEPYKIFKYFFNDELYLILRNKSTLPLCNKSTNQLMECIQSNISFDNPFFLRIAQWCVNSLSERQCAQILSIKWRCSLAMARKKRPIASNVRQWCECYSIKWTTAQQIPHKETKVYNRK